MEWIIFQKRKFVAVGFVALFECYLNVEGVRAADAALGYACERNTNQKLPAIVSPATYAQRPLSLAHIPIRRVMHLFIYVFIYIC
jgi:hypothetical protein